MAVMGPLTAWIGAELDAHCTIARAPGKGRPAGLLPLIARAGVHHSLALDIGPAGRPLPPAVNAATIALNGAARSGAAQIYAAYTRREAQWKQRTSSR